MTSWLGLPLWSRVAMLGQRAFRRERHPVSSLQAGPIPSGGAPSGTFSDSSAPQRTHLRLRLRRSNRRCSAIALALSRAALASSFIRPSLNRLDQHRDPLPAPDAGGTDPVPGPPP